MNGDTTSFQPQTPEPEKLNIPWHKTPIGIIFLIFLSLLIIGGLLFLSIVGYYLWQFRFGTPEENRKLTNTFTNTENFTANTSYVTSNDTSVNAALHVRPFNPIRGNHDAPVTVLMFIDFECPFCQAAYPEFRQVMDQYDSAVRFVMKYFPLESIHPNALQAVLAASCAQEQQAFWPYYDALFQGKQLDRASLVTYATNLRLDELLFTTCLDNKRYLSQIQQDQADGATLGIRGTPTYIINTTKAEGVVSLQEWDRLILDALNKTAK